MIYRHPAVLANMAATTDIISDGRLELGVGAGWNQMECDAYGIELPPLKERFDRFDEGVQAMIALLTETVANFDGQYVKLTDAYCEPKAVQTPHPPITIGGKGPKRTLRAVARWAQQWNVIVPGPEEWKPLKDILVGHCEDVGRDPTEITCSVNVRIDPDQPLDTRRRPGRGVRRSRCRPRRHEPPPRRPAVRRRTARQGPGPTGLNCRSGRPLR